MLVREEGLTTKYTKDTKDGEVSSAYFLVVFVNFVVKRFRLLREEGLTTKYTKGL